MIENLAAKAIADTTRTRAIDRYLFLEERETIERYLQFAPEGITDKAVLRLKRKENENSSPRTILISVLDRIEEVSKALKWAANVKDDLTNPESSDLYLFLGFKSGELSVEQASKYEANDLFCRKFIFRAGETIDGLIERTFVANLNNDANTQEFNDPLYSALLATSEKHNWLTDDYVEIWREAFLSGKTSSELIDTIITNLTTSKGSNGTS